MVTFGTAFDDNLIGSSGNDTIDGLQGSDRIDGGGGNDVLVGGGVDFSFDFSTDQLDTLTGGAGEDTFVLGDSSGAYYEDNSPLGRGSFATITDFNFLQRDAIQVFGSRADYSLEPFNGGLEIVYYGNNPIEGDTIGFIENTTNVDLNKDFIFVPFDPFFV